MLLGIDTSTHYAGVILWNQGQLLASHSWYSTQSHTAHLTPAVQNLMRGAKLSLSDLTGVAIALGPGRFSALRVGMSVAKGLCIALNIPVTGISTLELEAYPYSGVSKSICPIVGAGREQVAWAQFQTKAGQLHKLQTEAIIDIVQLPAVAPKQALFCGEGTISHSSYLKEVLGKSITVVEYPGPSMRLWSLAKLGWERQENGVADAPESLQPLYIRRPNITKPKPPTAVSS